MEFHLILQNADFTVTKIKFRHMHLKSLGQLTL